MAKRISKAMLVQSEAPTHAAATAGDEVLRKSIRERLRGAYQSVEVEVRDGFVLLRGAVRSFRQKEQLHRFVMSLRGVKALKDLLRVDPAESIADKNIAMHIRQALDAHAELPS